MFEAESKMMYTCIIPREEREIMETRIQRQKIASKIIHRSDELNEHSITEEFSFTISPQRIRMKLFERESKNGTI